MSLDPKKLVPTPPPNPATPPVALVFDGGSPGTVFSETIDGGTPSGTGPVLNGN
jgi:hypothetical protein